MDEPKGYHLPYGFRGQLPSGEWMLFSTQEEYLERYCDLKNVEESGNSDAA